MPPFRPAWILHSTGPVPKIIHATLPPSVAHPQSPSYLAAAKKQANYVAIFASGIALTSIVTVFIGYHIQHLTEELEHTKADTHKHILALEKRLQALESASLEQEGSRAPHSETKGKRSGWF
ncbi:uncharacterized protein SPPG_00383 [Spizellomyces punctatus DAOM BR117]|uniref:Uncharacterized protein n=1 Tax=Spizellomyces punctatus (strain DAOM BR117) TaxID=645134 RepID=A0A0L0HU88_SPIPD|nr:uncharacterized protein SPPG_00383 [Spizellomyces punctatus DAOM BR117]KND04668.1 hypothetical protein SPPG_00383 [Spizellomyces punctatus DAOM BR117]|eukprot:XP_016612707.1 hypothetical protein SPPG_00383 [Spizellomyces punctatus DAOM BR117]